MTKPLPKKAREKVIRAYKRGLGTISEIAEMFSISSGTVSNYLRLYRETGDLTQKQRSGKPRVLTRENLSILKKLIFLNKNETLQGLCAKFKKETGIKVALSTIYRGCIQLKKRS